MRVILTILLTVVCLSTQNSAWAIIYFPQYLIWRNEMEQELNVVFTNLVPDEERARWKKDAGRSFIGDTNESAYATWIPKDDSEDNWSECLSATWICKPNTGKTQYDSISALFEVIKENAERGANGPFQWTFTPLSNTEAIIERNKANGQRRVIQRSLMLGDWIVSVQYEQQASSKNSKKLNWDDSRAIWLPRISDLEFN